jgi:hypothetical protein|tara:strand:- start:1158 stop:1313 length:156 start_codon:yes stop_codon:yes gene_type:complete
MLEYTDLKIYFFNTTVLALSMTEIELGLKIILLICTIGYTISRWIHNEKNR